MAYLPHCRRRERTRDVIALAIGVVAGVMYVWLSASPIGCSFLRQRAATSQPASDLPPQLTVKSPAVPKMRTADVPASQPWHVLADFDADGDVDGDDFGYFARCFNGTGNPPACADDLFNIWTYRGKSSRSDKERLLAAITNGIRFELDLKQMQPVAGQQAVFDLVVEQIGTLRFSGTWQANGTATLHGAILEVK